MRAVILLSAVALGALAACGDDRQETATITVFAAASLTDAFADIAREFESKHPGARVRLNFAGSQSLRSQLELGAKADVFASADDVQMSLAGEGGLLEGEIVHFARADMAIIAHRQSDVATVADIARPGVKLVLAHESVPAGRYARELIRSIANSSAGGPIGEDFVRLVIANVASEDPSVKFVEQKVILGEADAGIVYLPGAKAAVATGEVRQIALPPGDAGVSGLFPIAVLKNSTNPELASSFVQHVLSPQSQAILVAYGFDAP